MDKKVLLQDLADGIARRRDIPKKDAEVFLRAAFDVIGEFLQTDKMVKVRGLGTFKLVTVDSRESVDVNTGERITIKEYTKVNFTPDPVLRDAVNKPFAQFETVVLYESTKLEDMERMDMPDWTEEEAPENETGQILVEGGETETVAPSDVKKEEDDIAFLPEGAVDEVPIESASIEEGDDPRIDGEETQDVQDDVPDNVQEEVDVTGDGSDTLGLVAGEMEQEPEETAEAPVVKPEESVAEPTQMEQPAEEGEDMPGEKTKDVEEAADGAEQAAGGVSGSVPCSKEDESGNGGLSQEEVRDVHVEKQQIEVQKVEHQTVNNQHIVQMLPNDGRKRIYLTPWMMFFLVLFVAALMGLSYYVGYHHLLAKAEVKRVPEKTVPAKPERVGADASGEAVADSLQKGKPDTIHNAVRDSLPPKEEVSRPAVKAAPPKKEDVYPQVKNGAYEIVGTQEEYRLRRGETLRGLALRYYGSKNFTVYIVTYNQIANPDVVPEGMVLKMPKLELKRR